MLTPKIKERWDEEDQCNYEDTQDVLQILCWNDDRKKTESIIVDSPESLEILREAVKLMA